MIDDTLNHIEQTVTAANSLDDTTRDDLLALVTELRGEVSALAGTHVEEASSVVAFTKASAHEATRGEPQATLLHHALGGLQESGQAFELTHPQLTSVVGRLCRVLAGLGI